eukprot:14227338-Alexandrium_andersonii.AAC.1
MSASLVGSEMCIRDSRGGAHALALHKLPAYDTLCGHCHQAIRRPAPKGTCLLYTSDAADDM